MSSRLFLW